MSYKEEMYLVASETLMMNFFAKINSILKKVSS